MKLVLLLMLISGQIYARPIVLLSYFNPFAGAKINNSKNVVFALKEKFEGHPDFEIHLCELPTVFEKSFKAWEDCLHNLSEEPKIALSLGEFDCNMNIEIMGRNLDDTGPDNEGNIRSRQPVEINGPEAIGLNYPLADMYCALPRNDRKQIKVSNNAGNFVCNHLTYKVSYHYQALNFGFIHVPNHHCSDTIPKTNEAIRNLVTMIPAAVKVQDFVRLPTTRLELRTLRSENRQDECRSEFYKRARGIDELSFPIFSSIK